jgi:hypothetical protein
MTTKIKDGAEFELQCSKNSELPGTPTRIVAYAYKNINGAVQSNGAIIEFIKM